MADDGHVNHEVPCAARLVEVVEPRVHGVLFQHLNDLVPRAAFAQNLRLFAPVNSTCRIHQGGTHVDGSDRCVCCGRSGGVNLNCFGSAVGCKELRIEGLKVVCSPLATKCTSQAHAFAVKGVALPLFAKVEICVDVIEGGHEGQARGTGCPGLCLIERMVW